MLKEKKVFAVVQAVSLSGLGLLLWSRDAFPALIFAVLVFLSLGVVFWRRANFWIDLSPYLILLLSYQSLREFAKGLAGPELNITNLISWEHWLTGGMPAAAWRPALAARGLAPVLDVLANLTYFSHFIIPVALSIWLYRKRKALYWPLLTAFLGLCYAGFLSYVLFPAAPPWWATQQGYLQGQEAVSLDGFLLSPADMARTPNPFAAMPSMHCAFPLYWALVVTWLWPPKSLALWGVTVAVAFSVVYLGHHYVVDVVAGLGYGLVAFVVVWLALRRRVALEPPA